MGFFDTIVPILIVLGVCGLLYAKVSYIRKFVAWIWEKITSKKEAVKEKLDRSNYELAFRYGN